MSETRTCPSCQTKLSPLVIDGQCPRCLGRIACESEADHRMEEPPGVRAGIARHLADYELQECLGVGGMGVVFRAHQKRLDRPVAIKVLLPGPQDRELWRGRFEREARALARLNHPNIISVFDFGRADEYSYLVMEYVEGANLRQLLQEGQLSAREALAIAPQLCDALQYAHDEGIVHRDIKPENILMDLSGHIRIADFGLAKIMGDAPIYATLTQSRQAMGTFRYMAPEQIDTPREVDHRADIFSLGVVLYEMFTGEVPVGRFDPPSHKSRVDSHVDEVVLRALQRDPDRRYQAVRDIKRGLLGLESEERDLAGLGALAADARKPEAVNRSRLFNPLGRSRPTQVFSSLGIPEDTNLFTLTVCMAGLVMCVFPDAIEVGGETRSLMRVLPVGVVIFAGFLMPLISLERARWDTSSRRFQWTRLLGALIVGLGYSSLDYTYERRLTSIGETYGMIQGILAGTMAVASLHFLTKASGGALRRLAIPVRLSSRFSKVIVALSLLGLLSLMMPWQAREGYLYYRGYQTFAGMMAAGALISAIAVRSIFHGFGYARIKGAATAVCGVANLGSGVSFYDQQNGATSIVFLSIAIGAMTACMGATEMFLGVEPREEEQSSKTGLGEAA